MGNFWKELKKGIGYVCANTFVFVLFVIVIFFFSQITECNGWGSVLMFVSCVLILLFVIILFWVIGCEQLEYEKLKEKQSREIKEKLYEHEKEIDICLTSSTEF